MKRRTIAVIVAAAVVVAGAVTGLVLWLSQPSYDEIADNCLTALKERPEGVKAKPEACDGLTKEDYDALALSQVLGDLGWTDEEGRFDKNRMLEDTLNETP
ncbi:hypothetical protein [Streptomyces sp. NPDC056337]|uniref:hypothetical protein n=1 Tax=Streptomyces sp. NPDC056337 TaxID=3345787 RepID=UPI0035E174C1